MPGASPMREKYLAAIVAVQQLSLTRRTGDSLVPALQILGEVTQSDRAYFFEMTQDADGHFRSSIRFEWCKPGVGPIANVPVMRNLSVHRSDPSIESTAKEGQPYSQVRSTAPPPIRALMELTGAHSLLVLPVLVGGRPVGQIGFDDCATERCWHANEVDMLRAAAGALAASIERDRAEFRLGGVLERLRHHIERSPLAVIEWNQDFRIDFWSPRAEAIFGWRADEIIGKTWSDWQFVFEGDIARVQQITSGLIDGTEPFSICRNRNYTKNGEVIHCEWYNSAIRGPTSQIVSTLSLVLDVSERVRAEEAARQALSQFAQTEKMVALGQMASGVAHDFNNALTVIIGKAELLLAKSAMPEPSRSTVEDIRTAGQDAAATVRRMQDFVRTRSAEPDLSLVSLAQLAKQTAELTKYRWSDQAFRRGVAVRMEIVCADSAIVRANPAELRELVTNLIFNAVDAMPMGGTLTLETGIVDRQAFLSVGDTGVGMDADTLRRCFEPFFTTKGVEGTGLGLAVSWSIAHRQGGELGVRSTPNHGTVFTLWLPLATAMSSDSPSPPSNARDSLATARHVLIVDDRTDVIVTLCAMVRNLNYSVESAMSGAEGLQKLRDGQFDFIISDLGMPGMDGREFARQAKQISPKAPIALLTGWADELLDAGATPEGVDHIVAKPLSLDRLRELLES